MPNPSAFGWGESGGSALASGILQLQNGVALDSTLRNVADQNNTISPLKLSTTLVGIASAVQYDWVSTPAGAASKTTMWFDASGRMNWRPGTGASSFIRTFDATGITADRVYSLPDSTMTLIGLNAAIDSTLRAIIAGGTSPFQLSTAGAAINSGWLSVNLGSVVPPTNFVVGDTSTSSPRGIMSWQSSDTSDGARLHLRKSRGTFASPTIITVADNLGRIVGTGYDGSNYLEMASILFGTEGTVALTRIPTFISFSTGTNAAPSVLTEAMRITSGQDVVIGGTSASSRLHVVGKTIANSSGTNVSYPSIYTTYTINNTGGTNTVTGIFLNATETSVTGTTHYLMDLQVGGTTKFNILNSGLVTSKAGIKMNNGSSGIGIGPDSTQLVSATPAVYSSGSDHLYLRAGNAGTIVLKSGASSVFAALGDLTSAYPALKRSGTELQVKLGDDSAYAPIAIGNTVQSAVGIASTHKVTINIGGTTYYLLASNV